MNTGEWALIIFTILSQLAVGTFVTLLVMRFFVTRKADEQQANRMTDSIMIGVIVVLGLGLVASIFHLGNPLNAPRAISNLATSWLSREILLAVTFGGLGLVYAALQWFKKGSAAFRNVLAVVTAVAGLALVFAQSMSYLLPTKPSWNTLATPVSFYATTLLLGVLATGAALVANCAALRRKSPDGAEERQSLVCGSVRWLAIASIVLVGVELVTAPAYLAVLSTGPAAAQASLNLFGGSYSALFILRLALAFIGAAVLAVFLYRNAASGSVKTLGSLTVGAFVLVLVAEVVGRFLFYATSFKIGL